MVDLKSLITSEVAEALQILDTTSDARHDVADVKGALKIILQFCKENEERLSKVLGNVMTGAGRLYIMASHLLPLVTAANDMEWWASNVPAALTASPELAVWQKSPQSLDKCVNALSMLMKEKLEKDVGDGSNAPGDVFNRSSASKRTADPEESDAASGGEAKKARKLAKKEKKKKKSKSVRKSSSSSSSSSSARRKKKEKKAARKDKKGEVGQKTQGGGKADTGDSAGQASAAARGQSVNPTAEVGAEATNKNEE
jgi:hypothetical protein